MKINDQENKIKKLKKLKHLHNKNKKIYNKEVIIGFDHPPTSGIILPHGKNKLKTLG